MKNIVEEKNIISGNNPQPLRIELNSGDDNSQFAENIINTVHEPLIVLDQDLKVATASRSFYEFFKVKPEETVGQLIYDLGNHQWDIPKLRELLESILPEKTTFDNYEVEHDFSTIGFRVMLLNARQIDRAFGKEKIILLTIKDVTERRRVEELLSEKSRITDKYLEIFLKFVHAPIIIWDSSLLINHINQEFEKLSGYNRTEVRDKKIDFLFPEDKSDSTIELIRENLGNEISKNIEIDILTKDKDIRTVLWNSANIFNKEGKNIVAAIANDITRRKRAQEKISMLAHSLRSINESASIIDLEDNIILVNESLLKLNGDSEAGVIDRNNSIFHSSKNLPKVINEILPDTLKDGWNGESWNKRKNGFEFPVEINMKYPSPGNEYLIEAARNITERKRIENELIQEKEKAEEINRLQTIFLANMSHELRTPLIGILGNAEFLESQLKDNELIQMAEAIKISGQRLNTTLNNILKVSTINSTKQQIDLKEKNILEYLREQVKLFKSAAEGKGLSLNFETKEEKLIAYINDDMFVSIIDNLLSNAIKYTDKGTVTITANRENNNAVIEVKDTGIGVSEDLQEIIFESFRQASEGNNRRFEGSGLGLTLVKKYTVLMGGTITLNSKPGEGSTFMLKIPINKNIVKNLVNDDRIIIVDDKEESNRSLRPKLLYVEDEKMILDIVKELLKDKYDVDGASNGEDALIKAKENDYDAFLIDIGLPGKIDGIQTTKMIKEIKDNKEKPYIAVTVYAMDSAEEFFLSEGLTHYISKPFELQKLLELIEDALDKSKCRNEEITVHKRTN